jgi:hypothetical protein
LVRKATPLGGRAGRSPAAQAGAHFTIPAIRKLITYSEQASGS